MEFEELREILFRRVDNVDAFSVRVQNVFRAHNIIYVGDIFTHSKAELLGFKHFGRSCLNEVCTVLTQIGVPFDAVLIDQEKLYVAKRNAQDGENFFNEDSVEVYSSFFADKSKQHTANGSENMSEEAGVDGYPDDLRVLKDLVSTAFYNGLNKEKADQVFSLVLKQPNVVTLLAKLREEITDVTLSEIGAAIKKYDSIVPHRRANIKQLPFFWVEKFLPQKMQNIMQSLFNDTLRKVITEKVLSNDHVEEAIERVESAVKNTFLNYLTGKIDLETEFAKSAGTGADEVVPVVTPQTPVAPSAPCPK